jgi:hypothetical protein
VYRDGVKMWEVDLPRATLAKVAGFYEPDTGDLDGDRRRDDRVRDLMDRTVRWLDDNNLVSRLKHSSRIHLLDDKGSSGPYVRPGDEIGDTRQAQQVETFDKQNLWIKLPPAFWYDGWIGLFTADELAAYLCLLSDLPPGSYDWSDTPPMKWSWWSQRAWDRDIRLKRDMRYSGFSKLVEHGVAKRESEPVQGAEFTNRTRKKFALTEESLDSRVAPIPIEHLRSITI